MKYKVILFDYDDTLVQTKASKWDALRATGKRFYNQTITDQHIQQYWGLPYTQMLEGVFSNIDTIANLRRNYEATTIEFPMIPHDNAVSVLKKIIEKYQVGIVTASARKLVIDDLTSLGFPVDKIFYIQSSEDTTIHKPDPAVFHPILAKLKQQRITISEVLYIGDSLKDYEAAHGAGLSFYGITHGTTSIKEFQSQGIKTVNSLSELLQKL